MMKKNFCFVCQKMKKKTPKIAEEKKTNRKPADFKVDG
jgi:hypothetical protein